MPRGLPRLVKNLLGKSRASALTAVANYNNPYSTFRAGAYIVHVQIAWSSLLLAILVRKGVRPFIKCGHRYCRIDGRPKYWGFAKCVEEVFGAGITTPVTKNLEFIEGLRNQIEHAEMPEVDLDIFGECQACLFNYEDLLVQEFGSGQAVNESLTLSLQFSQLRSDKSNEAVRRLHRPLVQQVKEYVSRFRSSLTDDIAGHQSFSYKVFLLPNVGNHRSRDALAVEWLKYDAHSQDQQALLERIGALIKVRNVPQMRSDLIKPTQVCAMVKAAIVPRTFGTYIHKLCAVEYGALPAPGSDPGDTNHEYCVFEPLNRNYGYTQRWVDYLIERMSDVDEFNRMRSKLKRGNRGR